MASQSPRRKLARKRVKDTLVGLVAVLVLVVLARWIMREGMSDDEIARRDRQCQQSEECLESGHCRFIKEPGRAGKWACAAKSVRDCIQSARCKRYGECTRTWRGNCVK